MAADVGTENGGLTEGEIAEEEALEEEEESEEKNGVFSKIAGVFSTAGATVKSWFTGAGKAAEEEEAVEQKDEQGTVNYGTVYHEEKKKYADMTDEEKAEAEEALKEKESWQSYGNKTVDQRGEITNVDEKGVRFDLAGESGESVYLEEFGGTVTKTETVEEVPKTGIFAGFSNKTDEIETTMVHYDGELGTFDYDSDEWALALKTVSDPDDPDCQTQVPILQYIGGATDGSDVTIPDGLKSLDYSFEGSNLKTIPDLSQDSALESAHDAFLDCDKLKEFCEEAYEDGTATTGNGIRNALIGVGVVGGMVAATVLSGGTALLAAGGLTAAGVGGGFIGKNVAKGHSGEAYMPDTIVDASGMFTDCDNLTVTYATYGTSCTVIDQIYDGDEKVGEKANILMRMFENEHREANPDGTGSNVTPEAAQDAMTGTQSLAADSQYSDLYDPETMELTDVHEGSNVSLDEAVDIHNNAKIDYINSFENGVEASAGFASIDEAEADDNISSMSMAAFNSGMNKNPKYYDDDGNLISANTASEQVAAASAAAEAEDNEWSLGKIVDRAGITLAEYGVAKLLTKHTWASVAIVAAGQLIKIGDNSLLPTSMTGILDSVSGWLGEDSKAGQTLSQFSTWLKGSSASTDHYKEVVEENKAKLAYQSELEGEYRDAGDKTDIAMSTRVNYGLYNNGVNAVVVSGTDKVLSNEALANLQYAGGLSEAKDGVLLTAANMDEDAFGGVSGMSAVQAAMIQDKIDGWAKEDGVKFDSAGNVISGELSEEHKAECVEEFTNLMCAYDGYWNGMMDGIEAEKDSRDDPEAFAAKSLEGADNIINAAACPFLDVMKEMDEKYNILENGDELDGYTDSEGNYHKYDLGNISSFSDYVIGSGTMYASDAQAAMMEEQLEDEALSEEDAELLAMLESDDDDMAAYADADGEGYDEDDEERSSGGHGDSDGVEGGSSEDGSEKKSGIGSWLQSLLGRDLPDTESIEEEDEDDDTDDYVPYKYSKYM